MATIDSNRRRIIKAMKNAGIYNGALTIQIDALAASLTLMQRAAQKVETLDDDDLWYKQETKSGKSIQMHPACRALRDQVAEVTRMAKQLKLTVEDVVGTPEQKIPLDDLTETLNAIK